MNKNLLITFDEHQKISPNKVPYTFIISNKKQSLYYFGAKHTDDLSHPQFSELKSFFAEFVFKTKDKDRIVLIEGGNWPVVETEEKAITMYGEMALVTYLAAKENMDRVCPEPPTKLLYDELAKKFTREEIEYFYFARVCYQWGRKLQKPIFENYIKPYLAADKNKSGWADFDFSLENMKAIHKRMFNKEFDENDAAFFRSVVDPTQENSIINKISRFEDEVFRDLHILGEIEKYWNEEKSIFIIYGHTHAVRQEPALRTLV